MDYEKLVEMAISAKQFSYSPYSRFRVGAALLCKSGKIYTGCNIESAAYSPSNCAERTAIFKAVSEGETEFAAIAVAGSLEGADPDYCYPCGVCRQVISEFVKTEADESFEVIVAKTAREFKTYKFREIMPYAFGAGDIKKGGGK